MTVKVFKSTDYGAPANTNAAGALIAILDACLVNGYGSQTVTITSTGGVATVTTPTAHALQNDTFIRIAGATQTQYNGDFPITVTGATTFTYAVTGSPASPATGTITSKVAPADWTKPFSGTNKAAYKQGAGSNGFYLRISDTTTSNARVKAFEAMTDVDTGTGDFPTEAQVAGGLYMNKTDSSTPQRWVIVASEKCFLLSTLNTSQLYGIVSFFGDIISNKSGDAFNTLIAMPDANTAAPANFTTLDTNINNVSGGHYFARSHTQIGGSKQAGKLQTFVGQTSLSSTGAFAYPNPIDNALHIAPIKVHESSVVRGTIPGIYNIHHLKPFQDLDVIMGTGDFSGKKLLAVNLYANNLQCLLEISNTW